MKNLKKFDEVNEVRPPVEKKYPELDKIVDAMAKSVVDDINKQAEAIKSEMPYKAQYILEELIRKLEAAV